MTPYLFELSEKFLTTSNSKLGRYDYGTRTTLNETIRHALRECKLRYVKKSHAIMINNEHDEANLIILKLKYL